jgi:CheY-like chemotaxis protein
MTKKILFVDDDKSVRQIAELQLRLGGYDYILAASGQEAMDLLKSKIKIDIIFLDYTMPVITGLDVLEFIKNNNIKIPAIIQTGIIDYSKTNAFIKAGAVASILKPYKKEVLFETIEKYCK